MRVNKCLFILIFLLSFICTSQKLDSTYIYSSIEEALHLNRNGRYTEAYNSINKLEEKVLKGKVDDFYLALINLNKGKIEINLGNYNRAIKSSQLSLSTFLSKEDSSYIADAYNLIGVGYYFLSNYDSTQVYYEKSYEIKNILNTDDNELAISAYNLAITYEDLGRTTEALEMYKEAEKLLVKNNNKYSFLSDIYIGITHLSFYNLDFDEAEKYGERAMEIGLEVYGESHPNMTFVYTIYSNILEAKGKYDEAISLLTKTLKIRKETFGRDHKWTCESNYDLGNAYVLKKQYYLAEKHYIIAIEIGERIDAQYNLAIAKFNLAKLYIDQNIKLEKAEELLFESLEKKLMILGSKNEEVTELYNLLAKKASLVGDSSNFYYFIDEAQRSSNYDLNNLNGLTDLDGAMETLNLLSNFYEYKYYRTKDIEYLLSKYDLIDHELDLLRLMQKKFPSEGSKIYIANTFRHIFEDALSTCWILYYKTSKEYKYIVKAFTLSETNRNTTLLEGIQKSQIEKKVGIPNNLLILEQELQQKLAQIKLDIHTLKSNEVEDKDALNDYIDDRNVITNELDSLRKILKFKYPNISEDMNKGDAISLKDIQGVLDRETQILTYFLGEKNLYSLNITRENITFLKGDVSDKIIENINVLKDDILNRRKTAKSSKDLYLFLLGQQMNPNKLKMVIIPDNVLHYIPFEILQNEKNETLIKNYTISYAGSIKIYLELKNQFFDYDLPNYWIGFSPQYEPSNSLSSTLNETIEISNLFDGKAFVGNDSSIKNFLENSKDHSIMHLAMHAEINDENPLYNRLIFSDGELTSSQIYFSDIKANLAVLSACNTGFGKLEKGEGVMSMARAFNYSGVPSIVMSLWQIPDKESKKIMISFYKHLKRGERKNEALKNAKLDYLSTTKDKNLRHPYYWSGFVLNGNTEALVPKKNEKYYFISGIILFASILLGYKIKNP